MSLAPSRCSLTTSRNALVPIHKGVRSVPAQYVVEPPQILAMSDSVLTES